MADADGGCESIRVAPRRRVRPGTAGWRRGPAEFAIGRTKHWFSGAGPIV